MSDDKEAKKGNSEEQQKSEDENNFEGKYMVMG